MSLLRVLVCTSVGARLGTISIKPRSANPGIKAVLSTSSMFMLLGAARARPLAARSRLLALLALPLPPLLLLHGAAFPPGP